MSELREVFEMVTKQTEPDLDAWNQQEQRQRRASRNRRLGALAVAAAIGLAAVIVVIRAADDGAGSQPAVSPSPTPPAIAVAETDYLVNLDTGAMTPLPAAIVGKADGTKHYAVSPDGSALAYVGPSEEGEDVFVADIDGTGIRQVTHDGSVALPSWSPDGTMIVYSSYGDDIVYNVFLLDLETGETIQVTFEGQDAVGARFSPDGSSIVYDTARGPQWGVRIVPVTVGDLSVVVHPELNTLLVGGRGPGEAGDGMPSPDGSMLAFGYSEESQALGTDIWIADGDGTDLQPVARGDGAFLLHPIWSPDGTRLTYFNDDTGSVFVADIATGEIRNVGEGFLPTWLNDHTLIVELSSEV